MSTGVNFVGPTVSLVFRLPVEAGLPAAGFLVAGFFSLAAVEVGFFAGVLPAAGFVPDALVRLVPDLLSADAAAGFAARVDVGVLAAGLDGLSSAGVLLVLRLRVAGLAGGSLSPGKAAWDGALRLLLPAGFSAAGSLFAVRVALALADVLAVAFPDFAAAGLAGVLALAAVALVFAVRAVGVLADFAAAAFLAPAPAVGTDPASGPFAPLAVDVAPAPSSIHGACQAVNTLAHCWRPSMGTPCPARAWRGAFSHG